MPPSHGDMWSGVKKKDRVILMETEFKKIVASHGGACALEHLGVSKAWRTGGTGMGKLTKYISSRSCFVYDGLHVTLADSQSVDPTLRRMQEEEMPKQAPKQTPHVNTHVGPPETRGLKLSAAPRPQGAGAVVRVAPAHAPAQAEATPHAATVIACDRQAAGAPLGEPVRLADFAEAPADGTRLVVRPTEVRFTHGRLQRLFSCGRSLASVAQQLRSGELLPTQLPRICIVHCAGKWYSRNNRRLWCFKEASVAAVEVEVGSADDWFFRGLNTTTDGWSVDFFPPCLCSQCGQEFPNRSGLKAHFCPRTYNTSAVDWDDDSSDVASSAGSEPGTYGEDGLWHTDAQWDSVLAADWEQKDVLGRTRLWRAAATGNTALVRKLLALGAAVDSVDKEGVTPLLAAVRRGHFFAAEELLWAGAHRKPWQLTKRKGKKWSSTRATRYDRLLAAVDRGAYLTKSEMTVHCKKPAKPKKKGR